MKKILSSLLISFLALPVFAQETEKAKLSKGQQILEKINFNGKLIMRYESDFNVIESTGVKKPDKEQLKYRANFGFDYPINDNFGFGFELITGSSTNQQASFNAFGDEFSTDSISLYKAYVRAQEQFGDTKLWGWVGKNFRPFWLPSQTYWDSDTNPEGFATGLEIELAGDIVVKPTGAYFIIRQSRSIDNNGDGISDLNGSRFADQSYLLAGQVAAQTGNISDFSFTVASGYFEYKRIAQPSDLSIVSLTNGTNDILDYKIINSAIQVEFNGLILPLIATGELYYNLNTYNFNNNGLYESYLENQRLGYRAGLQVGKLKKAWDFMIAYEYIHVEKFALVDYLAQDNYINNSAGGATASSNYRGHGGHLGFAFAPNFNLKMHYYLVEGIKKEKSTDARAFKGQRVRIDFTAKF